MLGWKHQFFWSRALDKFFSVHTGTTGTSIAFPTANRATRLSCKTVRRLGVSGKLLHWHRVCKSFLDRLLSQYSVTFFNFFNGVLIFIRDSSYLNLVSRWYLHFLSKQELVRPIVKSWHSFTFLEVSFYSWDVFVSRVSQNDVCSNHFMYSLSSNRSFNRRILNEDGLISAVSKFVRIQTVQFDAISYSDQVGAELPCSHHSFCC